MQKVELPKSVCLITPGHLCNCPRLIKEAIALESAGYQVHIIATSYMPYLVEQDKILSQKHQKWNIYTRHWQKGSFYGWLKKYQTAFFWVWSRVFNTRAIYPKLLNRNFNWQLTRAIDVKADLYIAHSAASIAVAALAASKNKVSFGFDAEDFHTGEDLSLESIKCIDEVQKKHLPNAHYISAASPLIAEAYQTYLGRKNIYTILNVFPQQKAPLETKKASNQPLRLFWFSQHIGKGRGLEWVFEALKGRKSGEIELHILGNLRSEEKAFFSELDKRFDLPAGMVCFHSTLPEEDLLQLSTEYDIGLSLETGIPLNRDLCLSNKLFVYLYAGLGIIATDTNAQQAFFEGQTDGTIFLPLTAPSQLKETLTWLIANPQKVMQMRQFNYDLAKKTYHWEKEQLKFISIVNQCLQKKSS